MNNFEKRYQSIQKRQNSHMKQAIVFGTIWGLVCFAASAGLVYVICHFISKFW